MMNFWITFGCFGFIAIPCILLFVCCGVDAKHKIGGSLVVIAFWVIISGAMYCQEQGNQERWNDGFCDCGQHWVLSGVSRTRAGTETKYYSCPNCYKEIKIIH